MNSSGKGNWCIKCNDKNRRPQTLSEVNVIQLKKTYIDLTYLCFLFGSSLKHGGHHSSRQGVTDIRGLFSSCCQTGAIKYVIQRINEYTNMPCKFDGLILLDPVDSIEEWRFQGDDVDPEVHKILPVGYKDYYDFDVSERRNIL